MKREILEFIKTENHYYDLLAKAGLHPEGVVLRKGVFYCVVKIREMEYGHYKTWEEAYKSLV
jgi:hypothetical protein